ncbi:MAG: CusA/CzcA family heavy metal efflux RND transporter [Proteobacteria bacterium]|nr:CusA/CzcA family heavy metal efflux RND transporter [Pseudomonadota bacterium]
MIRSVIAASVHHRVFVLLGMLLFVLVGTWAVRETPVDAIPDLSDVQVIVYTEYPGQAPDVVEDQVTYPLSTALLAVPYARDVRSYSFFGFSLVYVIFEDGTDLYWARSRVLEFLDVAEAKLPAQATTQLGPDATGVGWVYEYTLTDFTPRAEFLRAQLDVDGSKAVEPDELPEPTETSTALGAEVQVYALSQLQALLETADPPTSASPAKWLREGLHYLDTAFDRDGDSRISKAELEAAANFRGVDLAELRSIQDFGLRYDLMSLDGVSEVASAGGFVKQYQVEVDPEKLRAYDIGLPTVVSAIQKANVDVGGRLIELAETEFMIRGEGSLKSVDDLMTIPLRVDPETHTPVLLRQVARVQIGPDARRGVMDLNGEGEVVTGIVLLRSGENALEVIERVEERLDDLVKTLPEGVELHVSYDRSDLIERAVDNLWDTLFEEMVVVGLICALFLLHFRSALVALVTLPLGVLGSFIGMWALGVNANIMSLGGIAIAVGVMVDASVVMVDNVHKHRERDPDADQADLVIRAAQEVGPALFTSLVIVTLSFMPVFALEAQEGRLFAPLAWTKTLALISATLLSVTVIPPLMFWFVRGRIRSEADNPMSRFLIAVYRPMIRAVLRFPVATLVLAVALGLATLMPLSKIGSEFMPPLNEGDLLYMPTTPPGISITKARELLQQTDRLIAKHPQVDSVLGKIGRADTATDPAPLTMIETTILLTDEETWPAGQTIEGIIAELDGMVQLPGVTNAWTMPIKTRIDMLATGIKTPVGIKLLGDDLAELERVGAEIEAVVKGLDGVKSVYSERVTGGNYLDVSIRREDAARYGLNVADVNGVVQSAIGGMNVTWTVEGLERYPVNVRYPRELRSSPQELARVAVPTPMGHYVPLAQVADIGFAKGPPAIKTENARKTAWIFVDLETDDIGGFVRGAKKAVRASVATPPGVSLVWSGQYEYMERAQERLSILVPLTVGLIFIMLYLHFRRLAESMLVLAVVPFAASGGVWLLWALDYNLSVAVGVGFLALLGVASETGIVMLVYIEEAVERYAREGRLGVEGGLEAAVLEGAVDRVRPKIMTVAMDLIGLMPVMVATSAGSRVMKRIAAPMVGGMLSSTILTLVVIPAAYLLILKLRHRSKAPAR